LQEVKTHKEAMYHMSFFNCQHRLIDFNQTVACRLNMFIKITVRILTNSMLFHNAGTFYNGK